MKNKDRSNREVFKFPRKVNIPNNEECKFYWEDNKNSLNINAYYPIFYYPSGNKDLNRPEDFNYYINTIKYPLKNKNKNSKVLLSWAKKQIEEIAGESTLIILPPKKQGIDNKDKYYWFEDFVKPMNIDYAYFTSQTYDLKKYKTLNERREMLLNVMDDWELVKSSNWEKNSKNNFIFFDDIFTSGSTCGAIILKLLESGFNIKSNDDFKIITLARTSDRQENKTQYGKERERKIVQLPDLSDEMDPFP